MAISPKKTRVFVTVDRETAQRVREALKELGLGREYLSKALNDALVEHQAALEKLCQLKRSKGRPGQASFASLVLDWGREVGRLEPDGKAKRPRPRNGDGPRGRR